MQRLIITIYLYMCVFYKLTIVIPYKQFMLKVHGFNEDGTYGYNIIYVDTL